MNNLCFLLRFSKVFSDWTRFWIGAMKIFARRVSHFKHIDRILNCLNYIQ